MKLRIAIRIVEELAKAADVPLAARALYVVTMMRRPETLEELASSVGMSVKAVSGHCRGLESLGWIQVVKGGGKCRPTAVVPRDVEEILADETRRLMSNAPFRGEEGARRFVDWIVAPSVRLVYNARPAFLDTNKTQHRLELDIFVPEHALGIEYQGDQHFGPTPLFSSEKDFIERHRRDLLKASLCKRSKVRLVPVTKLDLTLEKVLEAITPGIPQRVFDPAGPYAQMLEAIGREVAGVQGELDRE